MHYLRFCCRSDLGAETIEKCEEFRDLPQRYRKSGGDIMMYTKRWLGDSSVSLIAAVTPEETAREIRNSISSPDGVADLRAISEKSEEANFETGAGLFSQQRHFHKTTFPSFQGPSLTVSCPIGGMVRHCQMPLEHFIHRTE